jgi:hypothetical protein
VKHRHKLSQRQRHRAISQSRRSEVQEALDEQPRSIAGKAKKRTAHQMRAEGGKTKHRLDKFRRGGRRPKRYDDGGVASGTSTRDPSDPGNETAAANRDRPKGVLERLGREIGPRSAYKRGGRQRPRRYDDGGLVDDSDVAPSTGGPSLGSGFGSALSNFGDALSTMAKARGSGPPPMPASSSPAPGAPMANDQSFIRQQQSAQKSQAVLARLKALESAGQKSMTPGQPKIAGNKEGGRIHKKRARER